MASDLINRSTLLAEYDRVHVGEPGNARKLIAEAPSVDAVEVVQCKDCAYKNIPKCCPYQTNGFTVPDEWYCSIGRKKDVVD